MPSEKKRKNSNKQVTETKKEKKKKEESNNNQVKETEMKTKKEKKKEKTPLLELVKKFSKSKQKKCKTQTDATNPYLDANVTEVKQLVYFVEAKKNILKEKLSKHESFVQELVSDFEKQINLLVQENKLSELSNLFTEFRNKINNHLLDTVSYSVTISMDDIIILLHAIAEISTINNQNAVLSSCKCLEEQVKQN